MMSAKNKVQTQTPAGSKAGAPQSGVSTVKYTISVKEMLADIKIRYADGSELPIGTKLGVFVVDSLGRMSIYDAALEAEIHFLVGPRGCGEVEVKTGYKGGKEQFIDFLRQLRKKYQIPRSVRINVITIKPQILAYSRDYYKRRHALVEVEK